MTAVYCFLDDMQTYWISCLKCIEYKGKIYLFLIMIGGDEDFLAFVGLQLNFNSKKLMHIKHAKT